jgi:hypothetical protein
LVKKWWCLFTHLIRFIPAILSLKILLLLRFAHCGWQIIISLFSPPPGLTSISYNFISWPAQKNSSSDLMWTLIIFWKWIQNTLNLQVWLQYFNFSKFRVNILYTSMGLSLHNQAFATIRDCYSFHVRSHTELLL